jgi:nicotinamide mononucleotide adenylyltransferase
MSDAVLALFGSFSPPTNGHLCALAVGANTLASRGIRVLKAVVVPAHVAYGKPGILPGELRLDMCRLMLSASPYVEVDDTELRKDSWTRTIDTLDAIQTANPGARVFLLCGIDVVESFETGWREPDIRRIVREFGIVVLSRKGAVISDIRQHCPWFAGESMDNVVVADANPLSEVSSTLVREVLAAGQEVSGLLDPNVEAYIREKGLYGSG